jgi:acetamidase/formamidase
MPRLRSLVTALALPSTLLAQSAKPRVHTLMPSPSTVAWGYYSAAAKPVLTVNSGDEVVVGTLITSSPTRLQGAGVDSANVERSLRAIYDSVTDKGPGGHILTGPIYVEGADSGDVLEVRIEKIDLAIPYAYNAFGGKSGFLPEDFGYSRMKIIPLDAKQGVAHFAPGIHAGNLDNKELVAGTTLFIPVWTRGALLEIGDGHAGQGNGEVDITALETSLVGRFRLIVRKDMHLTWPRGETPTHWIAMGTDTSLVQATKTAVRQAVDFLMTTQGLSHDDAYMLTSVACDVDVTELVDGNVGVHVMIPKRILARPVH